MMEQMLTWNEAYERMLDGLKIKLPEWGGYWFWSLEYETIMIRTWDKQLLDIRDTKDVKFTFDFILRDDWIAY